METTSLTLLERLRQPVDQSAWERFVELYTPLLFHWADRARLQKSDAADLIQDVFQVLVQKLPQFAYDQQRSFRGWLHTVLLNQWRTSLRRRTPELLGENGASLVDPVEPDAFMEKEYRDYLVARALQVMRTDFQPNTWRACWEHIAQGRPVAEVAAELDISVRAVYLAKARVLRRLRHELQGLWD
jgi:RNA polymerase sigma-70 factor, ECF subfamily